MADYSRPVVDWEAQYDRAIQQNKILDRDLRHLKAEHEALNESWDEINESNGLYQSFYAKLAMAAGLTKSVFESVSQDELLEWVQARAAQPGPVKLNWSQTEVHGIAPPPTGMERAPTAGAWSRNRDSITAQEYLHDHEERLQRLEDKLSALEENE